LRKTFTLVTPSGPCLLATLDCSVKSHAKLCQGSFKTKKTPTIRFFPHGAAKQGSKTKFGPSANFEDLEDEVSEDLPDHSLTLGQANMRVFINQVLQEELIGLMLYHNGVVPWWYKAIINSDFDFKGKKVRFAHYRDPEPMLLKQMGVPKLPLLILVTNKNPNKDKSQLTHTDLVQQAI
jgi:hypothetical protein